MQPQHPLIRKSVFICDDSAERKSAFREMIRGEKDVPTKVIHKKYLLFMDNDPTLNFIITKEIFSLHVPVRVDGYGYLRKAIALTIINPEVRRAVTRVLYPQIAAAFGTTPVRVERAIRHAIAMTWNQNKNQLITYFGKNEKPTNTEFITVVADKLRVKQEIAELLADPEILI